MAKNLKPHTLTPKLSQLANKFSLFNNHEYHQKYTLLSKIIHKPNGMHIHQFKQHRSFAAATNLNFKTAPYEVMEKPRQISSEMQKFHTLPRIQKIELLAQQIGLDENEINSLMNTGSIEPQLVEKMTENVIGSFPLPFSIATNFMINGRDYLIPMVIEEPSVVAGVSYASKLCRVSGGFTTKGSDQQMIAQIQLVNCTNWNTVETIIQNEKQHLIEEGNSYNKSLLKRGGGIRNVETRIIDTKRGKMLAVHLLVDVRDAMGANIVTAYAEHLSPRLEQLTGGIARMRILSNLAIGRVFTAEAVWTKEVLEANSKRANMNGTEIVNALLDAWAFADADPFRACTHNKGIMNGIDAVVAATGNDQRAIESGAHAYASFKNDNQQYSSLTTYEATPEGDIKGRIEIPLALGTVGGATTTHPTAKIAMKILGITSSEELGQVIACVGLAQNFAAMRALVMEGIQRAHMKLHVKNIIIQAGAKLEVVDSIAQVMVKENNFSSQRARELIEQF